MYEESVSVLPKSSNTNAKRSKLSYSFMYNLFILLCGYWTRIISAPHRNDLYNAISGQFYQKQLSNIVVQFVSNTLLSIAYNYYTSTNQPTNQSEEKCRFTIFWRVVHCILCCIYFQCL